MKEPMEVPPTRSMGMPASVSARRMPTWEQPLEQPQPGVRRRAFSQGHGPQTQLCYCFLVVLQVTNYKGI
jgi:hypothetical protein